jgi:hypothetical protein
VTLEGFEATIIEESFRELLWSWFRADVSGFYKISTTESMEMKIRVQRLYLRLKSYNEIKGLLIGYWFS